MSTISYNPSTDELVLRFQPITGRPTKDLGSFKLWWDEEGNIRGIKIMPFTQEMEEFKKPATIIKLGDLWGGITITDEDIKKGREELLQKIEMKW